MTETATQQPRMMDAHDLFMKSLGMLRTRGNGMHMGWLSDFLSIWIEPNARIDAWFAGENDQVKVWEFQVWAPDRLAFEQALPEAVFKHTVDWNNRIIYKITISKDES